MIPCSMACFSPGRGGRVDGSMRVARPGFRHTSAARPRSSALMAIYKPYTVGHGQCCGAHVTWHASIQHNDWQKSCASARALGSRKRLRNDTVFASPPYLSPQSSEIYCAYPSILCASYIRKSGKSTTRSAGPDGLHFKAPPRHSRHWSRSPCSRLPPRRHARPCRPPAHRSISGKVWARA